MIELELALALSARHWSDDLHRFLADHGGARVRLTAMRPEDLTRESFDVLLIDDICSFLSAGLVAGVQQQGRAVVGVYEPTEFADGKDRLLECGVSDVIEASADPDEFLTVVSRAALHLDRRPGPAAPAPRLAGGAVTSIMASSGGSGATEVALAVGHRLSQRGRRTVLVDLDERRPGVAPRLGLPLHPNVHTALDAVDHRTHPVTDCLHGIGALGVLVGGIPRHDGGGLVTGRMPALVDELRDGYEHVVIDLGGSADLATVMRLSVGIEDRIVVVATALPVGVVRLLDVLSTFEGHIERPVDILMNRSGRDRYRRGELIDEIIRSYRPASLAFLPDDPLVAAAAWDGVQVAGGRFGKAVERWVDRYRVAS